MTEYKNNENYPDPTAYEAIRRLEREKKKREKIKSSGDLLFFDFLYFFLLQKLHYLV